MMKHLVPVGLSALGLIAPAMAKTWPATTAEVIAASQPSDWRELDPERTLYMDLNGGRVVIELNREFAPNHVANIIQLVRQGYFNALPIVRSQDNYVVQWGDPDGKRDLGKARSSLEGEYERSAKGLTPFIRLPDGDVYAEQVGYLSGFPIAQDGDRHSAWLAHCYGMLGVGRGEAADSGSGAELYVVIGHSPRHLDRNVTLVGRVWQGMELLSTLQRGTEALGFYATPGERTLITQIQLAADLDPTERVRLEVLRTETEAFKALISARRTRTESWFLQPTGRVELCNVPVPVRQVP